MPEHEEIVDINALKKHFTFYGTTDFEEILIQHLEEQNKRIEKLESLLANCNSTDQK